MSGPTMHPDQVDISDELVRRLLREQHPHWADLGLERLRSAGTVNAIVRLGRDLCVRLPLTPQWAGDLLHEITWLPRLAPHLSVPIPRVVAIGSPSDTYPFTWAVYEWLEGEPWHGPGLPDEAAAAWQLAGFVASLHRVDATWSASSDHVHLASIDAWVRTSIDRARDMIDAAALLRAWETALEVPEFDGPGVWVHGDLSADNVLVAHGRLSAVIDWGAVHVGDPARDLAGLWGMLSQDGRRVFRGALDVDDGTWRRARGWAIRAVGGLDYYRHSNPAHVANCLTELQAVLTDTDP